MLRLVCGLRELPRYAKHLPVVPHLLEDLKSLQDAVLGRIFSERQVEAGAVQEKQNGGGRVEQLDPLLPLALLASHVKNTAKVETACLMTVSHL